MNELEKALLNTESIKIAAAEKPFWYTSGTIGPYFINTHFLIGNEKIANKFLIFIDKKKDNYKKFIPELIDKILKLYKTSATYRRTIDYLFTIIKTKREFINCEYISGGERRDWFFSPIIAHLSNKKILFIYKNLNIYDSNNKITDINGSKVCHICDLITQASSFNRAWIPAIKKINGQLSYVISIVDRDEGGNIFFIKNKIKYFSFVNIDKNFMKNLLNNKIINNDQLKIIQDFKKNIMLFGKNYLLKNPEFLKSSLSDNKTSAKAVRCINENIYNIDLSKEPFKSLKKYKIK